VAKLGEAPHLVEVARDVARLLEAKLREDEVQRRRIGNAGEDVLQEIDGFIAMAAEADPVGSCASTLAEAGSSICARSSSMARRNWASARVLSHSQKNSS
jgi:hypothetical protein